MGADHNLSYFQRSMPKSVRREAYGRLPETCNLLRSILTEAQGEILSEYDIDPAENVALDLILSRAFLRIRDEVTQRFRDEQMKLLNEYVITDKD